MKDFSHYFSFEQYMQLVEHAMVGEVAAVGETAAAKIEDWRKKNEKLMTKNIHEPWQYLSASRKACRCSPLTLSPNKKLSPKP